MMKKIIPLLAAPVLLLSLGCQSTGDTSHRSLNNKKDTVSPDSGFVKFDPSAMDSNPQNRKKITRIINGKESLHPASGNQRK